MGRNSWRKFVNQVQCLSLSDLTMIGSTKIPFTDLNDFLLSIKPFGSIFNVVLPDDLNLLRELYEQTLILNESTEFVIHRAAMPKIKRARSGFFSQLLTLSLMNRLTRVSVDEINSLLTKINDFPISIFGANDVKVTSISPTTNSTHPQAIRDVGGNWQEEASRVCADGAPLVSMTKLETLISTGEKLPLDYPEVSVFSVLCPLSQLSSLPFLLFLHALGIGDIKK
jgi:hypothetical protein